MPEIKWIKITTEMFDDEKIRIIESMPEADTLIVLWIRLICMAGKTNDRGYIYLVPEIPYTIEQLAAIFGRPLNTVKLAIETFTRLQMITLSDDGVIFLPAFERHQNIEGMERVRALTRKRVAKLRAGRQQQKLLTEAVTDSSVTVTQQNRIDKIRIREELETDEEKKTFDFWETVLVLLKSKMNPVNYKTWLSDSVGLEIQGDTILVGVPSEGVANYLGTNQKNLIENCLGSTINCLARKVDLVVLS